MKLLVKLTIKQTMNTMVSKRTIQERIWSVQNFEKNKLGELLTVFQRKLFNASFPELIIVPEV